MYGCVRAMYSCVGPCIPMEGHVYLWRAMYSCVGSCIAVGGHV